MNRIIMAAIIAVLSLTGLTSCNSFSSEKESGPTISSSVLNLRYFGKFPIRDDYSCDGVNFYYSNNSTTFDSLLIQMEKDGYFLLDKQFFMYLLANDDYRSNMEKNCSKKKVIVGDWQNATWEISPKGDSITQNIWIYDPISKKFSSSKILLGQKSKFDYWIAGCKL
ncbi:MAG: hypothetical protein ACM3PZ_01235 [Bacillota bacterium]